MQLSGGGVCFTIVLSVVAIFLDQCCAVIYERHIIHVPLYIHVVHHHHRQSKGQKLQKVPNFRPLPPMKAPLQQQQFQQQPQHFAQQQQQLQHLNQNQHSSQIIHPRHPQHLRPQIQQQKGGAHPALDAQWIHPSQIKQMLNPPGNHHRGQRPGNQGKVRQGPPLRSSAQQIAPPGQGPRPPAHYSTLHSGRPGAHRVPSSVRYVARHRTPPANDLSSYWYAYG